MKKGKMLKADKSLINAISTIISIIYEDGNTRAVRRRWVNKIGQIYTCSCFSREQISELLKNENAELLQIVEDKLNGILLPVLQDALRDDTIDYYSAEKRVREEQTGPIMDKVTGIAEDLIRDLVDNDKITQLKYKVPEGQKVKVKSTPKQRAEGLPEEYETSGDEKGEVYCIDGNYYCSDYILFDRQGIHVDTTYDPICIIGVEFELVAKKCLSEVDTCKTFLSGIFPEQKRLIERACKDVHQKGSDYMYWGDMYKNLDDEQHEDFNHSSDDVGDAIGNGDIELKDITGVLFELVDDNVIGDKAEDKMK